MEAGAARLPANWGWMPDDELRYVQYADRFGWHPNQVDDLPLQLEPWLLPIAGVIDEVRAKKQRR